MKVFEYGTNRQTNVQPMADSPKIDLKTLKEKPAEKWTPEERAALVQEYKEIKSSSGPRPTRARIFKEYGIAGETMLQWETEIDEEKEVMKAEALREKSEPLEKRIMEVMNEMIWETMGTSDKESPAENWRRALLLERLREEQHQDIPRDLYSSTVAQVRSILGEQSDEDAIQRTTNSVWNVDMNILDTEELSTEDMQCTHEHLPTDADLYPVTLITATTEKETIPAATDSIESNELSIDERNKLIEESIDKRSKSKGDRAERTRQKELLQALREQQNFPDLSLAVSWYIHFILDNNDLSVDYWREDFPDLDNRTMQECIMRGLVNAVWTMKAEDLTASSDDFMAELFNKVSLEMKKFVPEND